MKCACIGQLISKRVPKGIKRMKDVREGNKTQGMQKITICCESDYSLETINNFGHFIYVQYWKEEVQLHVF